MPSSAAASSDGPPSDVGKTSNDVAEDQRVEILGGLVGNKPRIRAARRSELVLSSIGDPGCQAEEESLNGNDVSCIDTAEPFTSAAVSRHPERGVRSGGNAVARRSHPRC